MKKIFLFLALLLSLSTFSQNKSDTEEWIKTQIEEYHYNDSYGFNNYQVLFDNGYMIIVAPVGQEIFFDKIPLKSINQATVVPFKIEDREGYNLRLRCKGSDKCIGTGKIVDGKYISSPSYLSLKTLYLNVSFKNDNLPERMKKALKHLVELNGGKLINDAF